MSPLQPADKGAWISRSSWRQGSWLIVESLDRISRQTVRKAARTMESIVEAGVTVADLSDGEREYSAEAVDKDHLLFLTMSIRFMRAKPLQQNCGGPKRCRGVPGEALRSPRTIGSERGPGRSLMRGKEPRLAKA